MTTLGGSCSFSDSAELFGRLQIARPPDGFLGNDGGVQVENLKVSVRQPKIDGVLQDSVVASNTGHLSETVQLSQIGLQVQVFEPITQFLGQFKGELICSEAVIGMEVSDCRLDAVKVRRIEPATHVEVGRYQSHPMHNAADASNDHEFHLVLEEPL